MTTIMLTSRPAGPESASPAESFQRNFKAALMDIRLAGVRTSGEASESHPYLIPLFTNPLYEYTFIDGLPYYVDQMREDSPAALLNAPGRGQVTSISFSFGGYPAEKAARVAVEAFRSHGLIAEWNGLVTGAVTVRTPFA